MFFETKNISKDKLMPTYYSSSFVDHLGRKIVVEWTEKLWSGHLRKHPQLIDQEHCSDMLELALKDPHVVVEGCKPGNSERTTVYYHELRRHQHFITYIKAVCGIAGNRMYVKTVFEETAPADLVIQEKRYPENFKETWRIQTNIL